MSSSPSAAPSRDPDDTPAGSLMSGVTVVWLLSLLLGLQPLTTDLYLPALPALREGFGASMAQAQLSLTGLLLAFGCSQLICGPLSDRFGRRPVLLGGMVAYVLASVGCALAGSMEQLLAWRVVQGAAMGAGVVCARALVRDLYSPAAGARAMSKGLSGLAVTATLSAPLGGLLSGLFGWRVALLTLALFGAATLLLVALRYRESVPQKRADALRPDMLLRNWWTILRHPGFIAYSVLCCCSYGGLFTFLAASSFVFIKELGISPMGYGLLMLVNSLAYFVGTFVARRLLLRWGQLRTIRMAGGLTLLAGASLVVLHLLGLRNVPAITAPMCLFMLAHSVHQSCGQSGAVAHFPHNAGAAAALNGFLMMLVAFATGSWLGVSLDQGSTALVQGIGFWSLGITLTAWTLVQRYGSLGH